MADHPPHKGTAPIFPYGSGSALSPPLFCVPSSLSGFSWGDPSLNKLRDSKSLSQALL